MTRHSSRVWFLACALAAAGCGEAIEPPSSDFRVDVVQAPASGTPGYVLEGVLLRVVDGGGNPRSGIDVQLHAGEGGVVEPSRVQSGVDGLLAVTWRLGLVTGPQVLSAHVATGPTTPVTVDARGLKVDAIDADFLVACGLSSGQAWCWGGGFSGRHSAVPVRLMPGREAQAVSVGGQYACVLDRAGVAWCRYRFATDPEQQVAGLPALSHLAGGPNWFCGLAVADGTPWCWIPGDASPVQVQGAPPLASISVGGGGRSLVACGLDASGSAWCWGEGSLGQLGDGQSASSETPVRVAGAYQFQQVSVGGAHVCGTVSGAVLCWGDSTSLELPRPSSSTPTPAGVSGVRISMAYQGGMTTSSSVTTQWGGNVGQGFNRLQVLQALPGFDRLLFREISADDSACAIGSDGTAWCSADIPFYETGYRGPLWLAVPEPESAPAGAGPGGG